MLAKSPPSGELVPVVHVRDGEVYANSKDVADYFGREHRNVLDAIRQTIADMPGPLAEKSAHAFIPTTYRAAIGSGAVRDFPCYDMTRDGFTLLVMGFTGKAEKYPLGPHHAKLGGTDELRKFAGDRGKPWKERRTAGQGVLPQRTSVTPPLHVFPH